MTTPLPPGNESATLLAELIDCLAPARLARNPKTGESVPVGEHGRVHFKPGLQLRDCINIAFLNS